MKKDISFWSRASGVLASLLSLLFCFWNVGANVWTMVSFYQEQNYLSMGVLIFLILSSSVLLQTFSWIWYTDSSVKLDTKVERFTKRHGLLALVHILQLGVFLRSLGMLELSVGSFEQKDTFQNQLTESPSYDLSTLGLFKAFSESAPQIILMLTNIIQMQDLQPFTVLKIISSLSSLSLTVLSYHRSMLTFVNKKLKMGWASSIIYFLWNLFLIGPRVVCVSLFASVLPCYVAPHFLSLWVLLVLWAWWQKTDFMDSKDGEWLYRATVGLIWYFCWFNVTSEKNKNKNNSAASGRSKWKGIIYHVVTGADTMLLFGLWWWRRSVESAHLSPLPIHLYHLIVMLMTFYIVGVTLKLLYYWKFHPKEPDVHISFDTLDSIEKPEKEPETAFKASAPTQRTTTGIHKRMRNMAMNFYCQ